MNRLLGFEQLDAVVADDPAGERESVSCDASERGDGGQAAALERGQHGPLGQHRHVRGRMVQAGHPLASCPVVVAGFQRQRPLPDRREHQFQRQQRKGIESFIGQGRPRLSCERYSTAEGGCATLREESQSPQAGFGQNQGIEIASLQLPQPRFHVAADVLHHQVAADVQQLRPTPQAARADGCPKAA